jgi:hypothetical protein
MVSDFIYPLLEKEPKSCSLNLSGFAQAMKETIIGTFLPNLSLGERIENKGYQNAQCHHNIKLNIDRQAATISHKPTEYHHQIGAYDSDCSTNVRETQLNEQMMQVGLVRMER